MSPSDGPNKAVPSSLPDDSKPPIEELESRSIDLGGKGAQQRYDKIDKELAQYVAQGGVSISKERSDELRKKIDRRVLVVMILTYFLQAIDKGTLSFASIMKLPDDTGMTLADGTVGPEVCSITGFPGP